MTRNDLNNSCYAVIRHNVRTYQSAGVMAVVKGKANAEAERKQFEDSQDPSDWHEGWRYFIELTKLKSGTDPALATKYRQEELEQRESEAVRETDSLIDPSKPHS